MAQLLAPYNNGMRLGQGFNSYTQQICLDRAVLLDTVENRAAYEKLLEDMAKVRAGQAIVPLAKQEIDEGKSEEEQAKAAKVKEDQAREDQAMSLGNTRNGLHAPPPKDPYARPEGAPDWVKPQIVTYSSRFVDKLSDVTDAMNISGSLSIKTATIGGKANGSYVDSDKFKESDVNFHLQVKVTNQIHDAVGQYCIFNKIPNVGKADFVPVYGDSFISGWEEGGELNAIISMKVTDKSKIFEIKAHLEAELSPAGGKALSGELSADATIEKKNLSKSTETTIAVNWAGGGSIKDPADDWTIETLKKAAAAFPELVAVTPQRTYAILTKYQNLETFQRLKQDYSLLDYENAGIYTNSLLDRYMDYKIMWKQLAQATSELEGKRASIEMGQPDEETYALARVRNLPLEQLGVNLKSNQKELAKLLQDAMLKSFDNGKPDPEHPEWTNYSAFKATIPGLIAARKLCRVEMVKIVNEVDLVTKEPTYALDIRRDEFFLHPLIFKQLLPVMRAWSDDSIAGGTQSLAPLILGFDNTTVDKDLPSAIDWAIGGENTKPIDSLLSSINKVAKKAKNYRMVGIVGQTQDLPSRGADINVFNDLKILDPTYRPVSFNFWRKPWGTEFYVAGIQIQYANGERVSHGLVDDSPTHVLPLSQDGAEGVFEVSVGTMRMKKSETTGEDIKVVISSIALVTTFYKKIDTKRDKPIDTPATPNPAPEPDLTGKTDEQKAEIARKKKEKADKDAKEKAKTDAAASAANSKTLEKEEWFTFYPPNQHWNLRGFFGLEMTSTGRLVALGCVWGRDAFVPKPKLPYALPLCRKYFKIGQSMTSSMSNAFTARPDFAGKFLLGDHIAVHNFEAESVTPFNALSYLDVDWTIKSIAFHCKDGNLFGLKVTYTNGKIKDVGLPDKANAIWSFDVKADLVTAKVSTAEATPDPNLTTRIQTLEFIRAEGNTGKPNVWPFNIDTVRFMGEGYDAAKVKPHDSTIEAAPDNDGRKWMLRGFYGWVAKETGPLAGLGFIWGCG